MNLVERLQQLECNLSEYDETFHDIIECGGRKFHTLMIGSRSVDLIEYGDGSFVEDPTTDFSIH